MGKVFSVPFKVILCVIALCFMHSLPEAKATLVPNDAFSQLAHQLKSPEDIAHFMWQNFSFETDRYQFGMEDYWQNPYEFLLTRRGDCEDFSRFAVELLKMNGKTAFLLNVYGNRFAHTVCVFKENGKYNIIDGPKVIRYEARSLDKLLYEIYPFWKKGALVNPAPASSQPKILAEFERKIKIAQKFSTSA